MSIMRTHTHHYVEIPAWFQKWALRIGFTVMSETHSVPEPPDAVEES